MGISLARGERLALTELLLQLGPDQPTLCAGWTTRELAAHLMIREHRPDAALGILGGPFSNRYAKVMAEVTPNFAQNVAKIRSGAPLWSPLRWLDSLANTFEFLIHHEDVLRAQPNWSSRDLSTLDTRLWRVLKVAARVLTRKRNGTFCLMTPDGRSVGPKDGVRVVGEPLELLLYLSGRTSAAQVEVLDQGPAGDHRCN